LLQRRFQVLHQLAGGADRELAAVDRRFTGPP
jgi:hypothetical protein